MMNMAMVQNERLRANVFFLTQLSDRSTREEKNRARLMPAK
jgi:hypothetical protein